MLDKDRGDGPAQAIMIVGPVFEERVDRGMVILGIAVQWEQVIDNLTLGKHKSLGAAAILTHEMNTGSLRLHAVAAGSKKQPDQHGSAHPAEDEENWERQGFAHKGETPTKGSQDDNLGEEDCRARLDIKRPLFAVPTKESSVIEYAQVENYVRRDKLKRPGHCDRANAA